MDSQMLTTYRNCVVGLCYSDISVRSYLFHEEDVVGLHSKVTFEKLTLHQCNLCIQPTHQYIFWQPWDRTIVSEHSYTPN